MIEFESKKKFYIELKENIEVKGKSRILNISICQGNSHLIISTENDLFMIYSFQELFAIKIKI